MNKTSKTLHPRTYNDAATYGKVNFDQSRATWNIFKIMSYENSLDPKKDYKVEFIF